METTGESIQNCQRTVSLQADFIMAVPAMKMRHAGDNEQQVAEHEGYFLRSLDS